MSPADSDEIFYQYEREGEAFRHILGLRGEDEMPHPKERKKPRRLVDGPLNNPLIEAYERLRAKLNLELNTTTDSYEKMALSQAVRALVNAIEIERLIHSPYEK